MKSKSIQDRVQAGGRAGRWSDWPVWAGCVVLALSGWRTISHATFWLDLAAGRQLIQQGIPRIEPFTVAAADQPWISPSWLYDLLLYGIWQLGGAPLVTLFHVASVVVAFCLLLPVARRYAGARAIGTALLLAAWLIFARYDAGPELIALLPAAAFLRVLARPGSGRRWGPIVWLLPLQVGWANLHDSFLWGPLLALLFAGEALIRPPANNSDTAPRAGPLILLVPALCVVTLVNPYGFSLLPAVLTGGIPLALQDWISPISQWFPTAAKHHLVWLTLLLLASGLLTHKQRLPLALTALAMISAMLTVRLLPPNLIWFALFTFPFCALSLQALGRRRAVATRSGATPTLWGQAASGMLGLALVLSAGAWWTNRAYVRVGHFSHFGLGAVESAFPAQLHDVLSHPDFPVWVLNLPMDGGYLTWAYPGMRPFIDPRASAHGAAIYTRLGRALTGDAAAWQAIEERYSPQAVILNHTWPHGADSWRHLRHQDGWEPIFFDGTSSVWLRATPERAALLAKRDKWLAAGLARLEAQRRAYAAALAGWRRPPIPPPLVGAATIFHEEGYAAEAATLYALLERGAPHMTVATLRRGMNLTRLGRHDDALPVLEQGLSRVKANSPDALQGHLHAGISAVELHTYERAIEHFRTVVDTWPDHQWAWLWLSRAYAGSGRMEEARQAQRHARGAEPPDTESPLPSPLE